MKRISLGRWLLLCILGLGILRIAVIVLAQEYNYLFIGTRLYDFQYSESLPFEEYGDVQWDEEHGFYGISESSERLGAFVDFQNGRFGYIWKDGERCFILFMQPEYGEDGNPHVSDSAWISCPETSQ